MLDSAGVEDEPRAIGLGEPRLVGLGMEKDQLLAKQGILGDEFGLAAREAGRYREKDRMAKGLGEVEESLLLRGN